MTELNLWLDSYDDIYSDFDSRHYQKRRVSEDFLHELKTEMKYKEQKAAIMVLLLPARQRNEASEKIITAGLELFFKTQYDVIAGKCRRKFSNGLLLFGTGVVLMFLNGWLSYRFAVFFWAQSLRLLFEPAGWFSLWAALDFLFYDYNELKKERRFYRELSTMKISFQSAMEAGGKTFDDEQKKV
ncbi:MAG: hypothetical protein K2X48_00405 [Chitinophagaceae bacterium]|nr:hypothetical protein [Chitinophagaceae bacterium]